MTPEIRAVEDRCRFTFIHLGGFVGLTTEPAVAVMAQAAGLSTRSYERSRGGVTEWEIFLLPASLVVDAVAAS
jgi:hypothetical protein